MKKNEYITIKEFAEKVGVSQQAIYKQLNNKLKKYLKVIDNKKMLNISALNEYLEPESNSTVEQQTLNLLNDSLNNLREQLKEKDKQIAELQNLINQEQQLNMSLQNKVLSIIDNSNDDDMAAADQEEEKSWFKRIFKK